MIPGTLIAALTFPGVIVHELAHQLFCRFWRVAIFDVRYFQFGNPSGYVIHEHPATLKQQVWITVGPFFLNSILGALIAAPASINVIQFGSGSFTDYVLVWLGVSIAMHAFPSTGDAHSLWTAIRSSSASPRMRAIAYPVVGIILLGALGSMVWLDLLYGIGVALAVPKVLVAFLA